jgi:hypothetical protein
MQIDTGFGDVVNRGVTKIAYPTLLEFTPPVLRAYPKETVVAAQRRCRRNRQHALAARDP